MVFPALQVGRCSVVVAEIALCLVVLGPRDLLACTGEVQEVQNHVNMALTALDALDEVGFRDGVSRAHAELACIEDDRAAAAVAQLDGVAAWLDGDSGAAAEALERALDLDPSLPWPEDLFPTGHPLSALRARVASASAPPPVDPPPQVAPTDAPSRGAWPFLVSAGLSAGAATGLWLMADQAEERAQDAADEGGPGSTQLFAQQRWRARTLRGVAGGAGLLSGRRFTLQGELGSGACSVVLRAWMESEGVVLREVALKVLRGPAMRDSEEVRRLFDEARLLALLRHPAFPVPVGPLVLDIGPAVALELVAGPNLGALVAATGPPPLQASLRMVAQVADGLDYGWRAPTPVGGSLHLIHRDVKPGNLVLDEWGQTVLLDLGVAIADFGHRATRTDAGIRGTPAYAAPERLCGRDLPAGDIYGLGLVLYYLLSGRHLLPRGREEADLRAAHDEALAVARDALADAGPLAEEVLDLLRACLAWEPSARPKAAIVAEQAAALADAADGPTLSEWARATVPRVRDEVFALSSRSPYAGRVVEERVITDPSYAEREAPPPAPPPLSASPAAGGPPPAVPRRAWPAAAALLAGAALALLWTQRPGDPPTITVNAPPAVTEPAPATTAPAPVTAEPVEVVAPEPDRPPRPPPSPARRTSSDRATVSVEGDASQVTLTSGGAGIPVPGPVPPGSYEIRATFPGRGGPFPVDDVTLAAGQTYRVTCRSSLALCRVEAGNKYRNFLETDVQLAFNRQLCLRPGEKIEITQTIDIGPVRLRGALSQPRRRRGP